MTTPGGSTYDLYESAASQPHLLIAGATGSGKSVVVHGIIHNRLIQRTPDECRLILLDPKRVELVTWRDVPHTMLYACELSDMLSALDAAISEMERRFTAMQARGLRKYDGPDLYVVIDELADLMLSDKKNTQPRLQRIAQLGRAARVHLIACTQCPLVQVIPTVVKCNLDSRIGLRTRSASDSRNILDGTGCEKLPRYGRAYYMTPEGLQLVEVPMNPESELQRVADFWKQEAKPRGLFRIA